MKSVLGEYIYDLMHIVILSSFSIFGYIFSFFDSSTEFHSIWHIFNVLVNK